MNNRRWRSRQRGQAIPLIGLLIVVLIGMAGLVVDGGQLTMQYRASQNAADAAALSAAIKITNGGTETQATAAALVVAQRNQIPAADLSVAYFDSTGAQTTAPLSVASVTANVTHIFSTLFLPIVGIDSGRVAATATVSVTQGASACVLCVMSSTASPALDMTGNGSLSLGGGNLEVNSTSASALTIGANAFLTVSGGNPYVVGGVSGSGNSHITPAAITGWPPAADPLASVGVPSVTGTQTCCSSPLNPGIYSSISISGNSSVTMNSGTYVVTGGISVSGNGTLVGHNVLIYLACSGYPTGCTSGQAGASLTVTGNGTVDLTAPSYGTYQGLTIFSDRNNTSTVNFGGNGSTHFVGTMYALAGTVDLHGNGGDSSVNARVVANKMAITGNGSVAINYTHSANYVVPNLLTLTN